MGTTPTWAAPQNGLPGDLGANLGSGHLNQLLGAHGVTAVYEGAQIVTPSGAQNFTWTAYGNSTDLSQPFTMSGTALGRVEVPLQPNGNGADVLVSLYADSGGSPNIAAGALASTFLSAQYLNQVCAPDGLANGGPLATANSYTRYFTSSVTSTAYQPPVGGPGGIGGGNSALISGSYISLIGGSDSLGFTNAAFTIQYTGGGVLAKGVSQPSLPTATQYGAISGNTSSMFYLGGVTGASSPNAVTAVYSGAWNANTGQIASWSSQTALPAATTNGASALYNGVYLYLVGGSPSTTAPPVSTVYVNTISNSQLGAWSTTTSLPVGLNNPYLTIVGNWLVAAGGNSANAITVTPVNTVYYAAINPNTGALGAWQTGPALPTAVSVYEPGWNMVGVDDALIFFVGQTGNATFTTNVQILAWDAHGPASEWRATAWPVSGTTFHPLGVSNGDGSWDVTVTNFLAGLYYYTQLLPVPVVSVPLPATGLSNGATYHVVLRQFSGTSASDYVSFGTLDGTPLSAAALTHGRYTSGAWTSVGAGRSVPMSVFDQTASTPVWHTWEDPSTIDMAGTAARWSTLLYDYRQLLIGVLETTSQPNVPLNANPTFTSGVSPWVATNGTLTQSAAQTHGGYPFSGLLTPTGGFAQAYTSSELFPVTQTPWGAAQRTLAYGWFYTPTTWSNFSLSVNWFDSSKTYISTSFATVSLTGATWTQVSNVFQPPATAAYAALVPTMSGSPASSQLLYMSYVPMLLTPETVPAFTSAATVSYPNGVWPPVSATQLN